jgi:mannan endo-1,4-beta-mannosidase
MRIGKSRRSLLLLTIGLIIALLLITFMGIELTQWQPVNTGSSIVQNAFVTRSGSQLMLNGNPFRFGGANIHWLLLNDSADYPSQFQVNDALASAKDMGITVVRSHTLGISTGCANCIEPSLGVFNKTALVHDDYVIKVARDYGIRFIIPLTDNWHYAAGGKHNFTEWRDIADENQFYSNDEVIKDFETYISTLLNHVNIYTGIAYKDDPTIMAWETGNELIPPITWTRTISAYIKRIDNHHLVMDGRGGIDPEAANLANVDIVSDHYYPKDVSSLESDARLAHTMNKVFVAGEFDWNDANGGDSLSRFLSAIESNPFIAGDAFWELWPHDDRYGYVKGQKEYMFHYPGDSNAMRKSAQQLRTHAYHMRQVPIPAYSIPASPTLGMVIRNGSDNTLIWRGVTGAASYTIERSSSSANGPWRVICNKCATDAEVPWVDKKAPQGTLWYRIIAYNFSGVAGEPSRPYQG